ncbi:ribbon-helix-helix domain-containing protein [Helicobacter sp.]|uniref:ribbon-helix-helix domain-containing protein n=1 Tax=Helicobacter sp. TaxID=218 RepID=UPI0025C48D8D|nr:ribbon-helix-helix domain-containing protein [Helicobacter sp.]MCI5968582.1 ribbon-helix-helix domain-containing protein [Helicobacter sp.]MDY2584070.1 ribbon-helix-helix domain-containing protein [Helicobacter sp.]
MHSCTFYLSQEMLQMLDIIALLENQSRSVIVECALMFKKGKYDWQKCKAKTYKKKKKIPFAQRNLKRYCKQKQASAFKQECLFANGYQASS